MYTYIYTEKPMNFYRTGKVIGVTGGVSINLEGAQFKHKALMIPNGSFTGTVQLFGTMYDSNNPSPLGITLVGQATTTGQTPYIFPGIFRSVTTNFNGRIVLLN